MSPVSGAEDGIEPVSTSAKERDPIDRALESNDFGAWSQTNRAAIDAEFIRAVKRRLDDALRSDPRHALTLGELAVAAAKYVDQPTLVALATRGKAQALHQTGACAEAVVLYEEASNLYRVAGDEIEGARTLIGAIDALGYIGRTNEALATAARCIDTFERHGEHLHRAKVDLNVGNLYHRLERNREASDHYWRARRTFARYGEKQLAALADTNLGNVATNLCNYRAARSYYQRAARTLVGLGAETAIAMNDADIGWLHFIEGDFVRALAIFHKARRKFEEYQLPRHVATCNADLAEIYLVLDNLDAAQQSATDAHEVFASLGHMVDAGKCLMTLGAVEFRRDNRARAISLLKEARDVLGRAGHEALELTSRLQLADIYLRSGDAQGALVIASEAVEQFERLELNARQGHAETVLGRARAALGDTAGARRHFEKALKIGAMLGSQSILIEANIGLGRVTRETEGPLAAVQWFDAAREYVVRVRGMLHPEALKTSFLDGRASVYTHLVEAILAAGGAGSVERALEVTEEAKSQALVDMLAGRVEARIRSDRTEDRAVAERVRGLQKELAALYSAVDRHEQDGGHRSAVLATELKTRLGEREQELTGKLIELGAANAEYVSLIRPTACQAPEIQGIVPAGAALIEYFAIGERVVAFVVTRERINVVALDYTYSAAQAAADDLTFEITRFAWSGERGSRPSGRMSESLDRRLSDLYNILIAPLGPLPEQLIIVPHRALHAVPMHALRGPEGYLVDRHVISYAPSAGVLRFCLQRDRNTSESALVMGVTADHLPFVARESADVAAQFSDAKVLTGAEASAANLKRLGRNYDVVHIASRGAFRDEKPIFSGVRMADGWLSVIDAYDIQLNASLVTLSACQTGINCVSQSDEVIGLVRGFLYAGASAVMASLWSVDDRSTAEFMPDFYATLRNGASRAAALRQAQLAIKAQLPHPYHWAPFVLIGRW
jgi:CHAT domain-containing protein/tetratricopeptide (TPR) repeat protein